jgi:hypothetical protein
MYEFTSFVFKDESQIVLKHLNFLLEFTPMLVTQYKDLQGELFCRPPCLCLILYLQRDNKYSARLQ